MAEGERRWRRNAAPDTTSKTTSKRASRVITSEGLDPEVEKTLEMVKEQWPEMLTPISEFDPVTITLDIISGRAPPNKALKDLEVYTKRLEADLNRIINEYHLGFNNSIQTFSAIVVHVTDAQQRVHDLKRDLLEARHFLQILRTKREGLSRLWSKSIEHNEIIKILSQIEDLKRVPNQVETHLSRKHYLHAVQAINQAQRQLSNDALKDIDALSDLRRVMSQTKDALPEILIEQMQTHLFLRAPNDTNLHTLVLSDDAANLDDDDMDEDALDDDEEGDSILPAPSLSSLGRSTSGLQKNSLSALSSDELEPSIFMVLSPLSSISEARDMYARGINTAASPPKRTRMAILPTLARKKLAWDNLIDEVIEELDTDPESDSLQFLAILVESLAQLHQLPLAVQMIKRTLKLELFQIAEDSVNQIDTIKQQTSSQQSYQSSGVRKSNILRSLLSALYRKYRVVYKRFCFTLSHIQKNIANTNDVTVPTPHDVWEAIQDELEALLRDYLNDAMINNVPSTITAPAPVSNHLPKSRLFSFADTEGAITMALFYREKKRREKESHLPTKNAHLAMMDGTDVIDDMYMGISTGQGGHRLVVPADPLNIAIIFRPTEKFTTMMGGLTGQPIIDCRLQAFVHDFVLEQVLPLIKNKVLAQMGASIQYGHGSAPTKTELFMDAASDRPLLKSAVVVLWLVRELCKVMTMVPLHHDKYISLVEILLVEYLNTCQKQFDVASLVAEKVSNTTPRLSAMSITTNNNSNASLDPTRPSVTSLTENGPLVPCLSRQWIQNGAVRKALLRHPLMPSSSQVINSNITLRMDDVLNEQQTKAEIDVKGEGLISRDQLVWDPARLLLIATLYTSLTWLIDQIDQMRDAANDNSGPIMAATVDDITLSLIDFDNIADQPPNAFGAESPTRGTNDVTTVVGAALFLLMEEDSMSRFDELITKFKDMARECLLLLRTELRCHVHFFLDLAVREGNYTPPNEAVEPDAFILALNKDLVAFEDAISRRLSLPPLLYVFDGVPQLLSSLVCINAKHIQRVNQFGGLKMARNIFALQKCLSVNVAPGIILDRYLDRARQFYTLLDYDAENLVVHINQQDLFSPDELEIILTLILKNASTLGHDAIGFNDIVEEQLAEVSKRTTFYDPRK